jgi:hypothetical protein
LGTLISRKSECVIHRSVGHRDRKKFCDLFAEFIVRTYVDDSWVLQSHRPDLLNDGPPFGQFQFTVLEVERFDGVSPLLCMLFNRSLAT